MNKETTSATSSPAGQSGQKQDRIEISRRHFGKAALAASAGFILPKTLLAAGASTAPRARVVPSAATNIVLVHGAFADGTSWSRVIPILEAKGFNISAVQNPLTSLPEDVATTRRLLAKQSGPTIVVGHSYAGFVITQAGNEPSVAGLVYISSYGPAEGVSHDDAVKRFPPAAGIPNFHLDEGRFLLIARDKFQETFCHDVDAPQARIMATVQKPLAKKCFAAPIEGAPAWKSKPSWFLISTEDRLINPDLQRFMANRMGATVATAPSSHASLVSHPVEAANLIIEAASHIS